MNTFNNFSNLNIKVAVNKILKMDVVKQVLDKQREELSKYKPITVTKEQEVAIDVGK